jgi:N-acetylmuramoyl-L-alanine amidase
MSSARPPYVIDDSYQAKSYDKRIKFLVLHYTAGSFQASLDILTKGEVSSHYLVPAEKVGATDNGIFRLVAEGDRAFHAGVSSFRGRTGLNDTSIGIEIVNQGYTEDQAGVRTWYPFTDYQIDLVIALSKDIIARYGIESTCVIGHNDIAPGRKPDPGPLFPWKKLAEKGVGAWHAADIVSAIQSKLTDQVDVNAMQAALKKYGYNVLLTGVLDQQTKDVITAFNRHFLATDSDLPSREMRATLSALITQYFPANRMLHESKEEEEDGFVWVSHADTPLVPRLFPRLVVEVNAAGQQNDEDYYIDFASPTILR